MTAYYEPEIVAAYDYYPFGMLSRIYLDYNYSPYKFGFNGKEFDHEAKGYGAQLDYGMMIYDPRCGCFLSVDPLTRDYPHYTPYQFAGNNPILNIDLDGLERCVYLLLYKKDRSPVLKFMGIQKREIAVWELVDFKTPATNFGTAQGDKITTKSIRVWQVYNTGYKEGDDLGRFTNHIDFANADEFIKWKQAGFPARPVKPVDPKAEEIAETVNTLAINQMYYNYDLSDGTFGDDGLPDITKLFSKGKSSPTEKVSEQANAGNVSN